MSSTPRPSSTTGASNASDSPTGSGAAAEPASSSNDLLLGVQPGYRYRCDGCGNVTRFDVTMTATTRRFHHFDLGGVGRVEEEEVLAQELASVTCRWCQRTDAIRVERAPASTPEGE